MVRDMKFHIYSIAHEPLCWDGMALEFDSRDAAADFLSSAIQNSSWSDDFWHSAIIVEDILYYDGGYMDGTLYLVGWDAEGYEECLILKTE